MTIFVIGMKITQKTQNATTPLQSMSQNYCCKTWDYCPTRKILRSIRSKQCWMKFNNPEDI